MKPSTPNHNPTHTTKPQSARAKSRRIKSRRKAPSELIHVYHGLHESWPECAHKHHQIIILLASECAGTLTWSASGKHANLQRQRYDLAGQRVLFIEKQTLNSLCFETPSPIVALRFTDKFLAELAPEAAWQGVLAKQWYELLKVDARINSFFECAHELCQHKVARQSCDKTAAQFCSQTPVSPRYIHALSVMLVVHLLCANRPLFPGERNAGLSPEQLRKVQRYIDTHFKEPLSITALYRLVGLDKNQFGRRFKHSMGMLPRRYILSRRVAYAQELLRRGRLRVAEVANEAGFSDQSHMRHCLRLFCNAESPRRKRIRRS